MSATAPDEVVEAIRDQAGKYLHSCFMVQMYEPYIALAKELNELVPAKFPKKTMFVNSGAEAVENAVKIARYYTKRPGILCFENAFHGRTAMTMSLTSKVKNYKYGFWPFMPEVYRAPYAYCYRCSYGMKYPSCGDLLRRFHPGEILRPVRGRGIHRRAHRRARAGGRGVYRAARRNTLASSRRSAEEHGIVFIVDEVQTGFGRTGKMFAFEHFGVEPDMIVTAKSLAAGLPLAGVTGKAEIMDSVENGGNRRDLRRESGLLRGRSRGVENLEGAKTGRAGQCRRRKDHGNGSSPLTRSTPSSAMCADWGP